MDPQSDVSLTVDKRNISGWTSVRVTRGIERVPGDFDISMTSKLRDQRGELQVVAPGDPCVVRIGGDVVITGYVDRVMTSLTADSHTIRAVGRGKCADLVDCSAEWPGSQISGTTARGIARRLAEPYGIEVIGDDGVAVPQTNLIVGETAWEVIERICRFSALLAIETPDGNLQLTQASGRRAASGFVTGQNIETFDAEIGVDQRYSEYWVYGQAANLYADVGNNPMVIKKFEDPDVRRHRRKAIVADSGPEGTQAQIAPLRAQWEMNRRAGRSHRVAVTVDSWRDSAGKLWTPNTIAPIVAAEALIVATDWLISEVTYRRDNYGTRADVTLMPAFAFLPEPLVLLPTFPDVPANIGQAPK